MEGLSTSLFNLAELCRGGFQCIFSSRPFTVVRVSLPLISGVSFRLAPFLYVYQLHTNVLRALFSAMPDFMGRVGHSSTAAVDETMRINWLVLFRDE